MLRLIRGPDNINIQFLFFEKCPWARDTREALEAALAECGLSEYESVDILDPQTPEKLRCYGSPTILVNGHDVMGAPKLDVIGCRIYPNGEPSKMTILASIKKAADEGKPSER